jgi:hypothetical protein
VTNLLEIILKFVASVGTEWYQSSFFGGLSQIPQALLSFILSYLVIQLFFFIFPPLKRIMMILGAPFRYMHVWLHVDTARRIESKKYGINKKKIDAVGFWGESKGNDMIPLLHTYFSTSDAIKIASAPLIGAVSLFIFLILSSPIFAGLGLFGTIFHIYLLFCCLGIAFPSLKDYSFLFQGTTAKSVSVSPIYFLWTYFIFAISGYITLQRTSSSVTAIRDGIFYSLIYILLILAVSRIDRKSSVAV